MTAIQDALRDTQNTIRYISNDMSENKRRIAESKLMAAQLDYKKAASEAEIDMQRQEMNLRREKLKLLQDSNKPVKFGDMLTLMYGSNPEMLSKITESFEQSRPGFVDSEVDPRLATNAFQMLSSQIKTSSTLTPEEVEETGLPPGTVAQKDNTGKINIISSPRQENQTRFLSPNEIISSGLSEGTIAQMDEKGRVSVLQRPSSGTQKIDSEKFRKVLIRQFSEEIKTAAENNGALPEDVMKNPELYFPKESLDFFRSVENYAIQLKQANPKLSDTTIAAKAKKDASAAVGSNLVNEFQSITDPEGRRAFVQELQQKPFTYNMFKDAAAKFDKNYDYGKRKDGTKKGKGFLGEIKNPDGTVSTELSVGVNINGEEIDIPLIVPTTTMREIRQIRKSKSPSDIPPPIVEKAVDHAKKRLAEGKSPFYQEDENLQEETKKEKNESFLNRPYETTPMGKLDKKIRSIPGAIKKSEATNKTTYEDLLKKRETSGIPSLNTFKRTR